VERLIVQDKVDFVLPPAGSAANIAAAPTFAKHGLPLLGTTVQTERAPELAKRWPNLFFLLGDNTRYADALMDLLEAARKAGKIGDKVAMIHVADAFGVENASAARRRCRTVSSWWSTRATRRARRTSRRCSTRSRGRRPMSSSPSRTRRTRC
jgi:branched-chain amino acid transport system substrate-binding protein